MNEKGCLRYLTSFLLLFSVCLLIVCQVLARGTSEVFNGTISEAETICRTKSWHDKHNLTISKCLSEISDLLEGM